MSRPTRRAVLGGLLGLAGLAASPAAYGAKPIVLGTTTSRSGPSAHLGRSVSRGLNTAFRFGSIGGRPVELRVLDDGYRPDLARRNMDVLCQDEDVLAVVGNVGTPTAEVTHGIAEEHGLAFFGAVTGADRLRREGDDHIWNFRASYSQELANIVGALVEVGVHPNEFAFFGQDDGYGNGVRADALGVLKLATMPSAHYQRNTLDVERAVRQIWEMRPAPRVVVMGGTALPTAKFVHILKPHMRDTLFLTVSFVGTRALTVGLGPEHCDGVVVTQVVPPLDHDVGAVREFLEVSPREDPNLQDFEGYIVGRMMLEVLERAHQRDALSRAGLLETLQGFGRFQLDLGTELALDADRAQASNAVWPTIIRHGKPVHLDVSTLDL